MKKIVLSLFVAAGAFFLSSCEDKGPVSHSYFPDRSDEETLYAIIEASRNDGFYLKYSTELYYCLNGEWKYYGIHDVYGDPNAKSECNDWVRFGDDIYPAYYTDRGGYRFRVNYNGTDYYYH